MINLIVDNDITFLKHILSINGAKRRMSRGYEQLLYQRT